MRFFGKTEIDFLGMRFSAALVSATIIVVGIGSVVYQGGLSLGIDFAGGSQIVVRFASAPDLGELRRILSEESLEESQIQEFSDRPDANEVLIRTPRVDESEELEVVASINRALERVDPPPETSASRADLNTVGSGQVVTALMASNPLELDVVLDPEQASAAYRDAAGAVLGARAARGLLGSWNDVAAAGIDPRVLDALQQDFYLGGHAVVNTEWVGPQVGQDLRRQTVQAMAWALAGLLAYISYRFEFRHGVAAVIALVHDVSIALGAFSLTGREFNLPVVAAFLTIIGYSLNDTVVVFDRIRENNQVLRRMSLYDRINTSVNQTLARTVLTSGTTLLVVTSLYLYGGPVINNFAFALLVGVIAGTYSSIFVASPIIYSWQSWAAKKAA